MSNKSSTDPLRRNWNKRECQHKRKWFMVEEMACTIRNSKIQRRKRMFVGGRR